MKAAEAGSPQEKGGVRLWRSILLAGLIGAVPMLLLSYFLMARAMQREINFARLEMAGNEFLKPLLDLLDELPRQQSLAARAAAGDTRAAQNLQRLREEIGTSFQELAEAQSRHGKALKFTGEELDKRHRGNASLETLQKDWETIENAPFEIAAASEINSRLISAIRTMIKHTGDMSNLVLDPQLDSYYVADITLVAIPQAQQRLADSIRNSGQWLRDHQSEAHKADIAIYCSMIQNDDEDRITGAAQTALIENANLPGASPKLQKNLPSAVQEYVKANQRYLNLLKKILDGTPIPEPEQLEMAGWEAHSAARELWQSSRAELDGLLEARISGLRREEALGCAMIGAIQILNIMALLMTIRRFRDNLNTLLIHLFTTSRELAASTSQISASSGQLAQGVSRQASSIEKAGASLVQILGATRQNAETSGSAREFAVHTLKAAESAAQSTAEMDSATQSISAAGDEMNRAMERITASNRNVARIIKTIDEIAFQTNILALNAAVEAARAGQAGLGFSVVAEEVRGLARRSAAAAKETAELVEAAILQSETGTRVIEKARGAVEDVIVKSATVAGKLREIVEDVRKMDLQISGVAEALARQNGGLSALGNAVCEVEEVTRQNSSTADESANCCKLLNHQSRELTEIVSLLQSIMGQKQAGEAPAKLPVKTGPCAGVKITPSIFSPQSPSDTSLLREDLSRLGSEAKGRSVPSRMTTPKAPSAAFPPQSRDHSSGGAAMKE